MKFIINLFHKFNHWLSKDIILDHGIATKLGINDIDLNKIDESEYDCSRVK